MADIIKNIPTWTGIVTFSGNSNYDWLSDQCFDMKGDIMEKANTVLFEDMYKVKIKDFFTTCEVDKFVAMKTGKKSLKIVSISPDITSAGEAVIPVMDEDINGRFDKAIKK